MFTHQRRGAQAFTLIELIVAMVILAVLLAVLLPAIGHALRLARSSRDLSTLRAHAQSFSLYYGDFGDVFPYFTEPGHNNVVGDPGVLQLGGVFMFDAHQTWHLVLGPIYYDAAVTSEIFFPSDFVDAGMSDYPYRSPYNYPCAFIARPDFWIPATRHADGQFAPTSVHEVTYPAMKSLVILSWPYTERVQTSRDTLREELHAVMVDASAHRLPPHRLREGYNKGDGVEYIDDGAVHFTDFPPLLHTRGGVHGIDIR